MILWVVQEFQCFDLMFHHERLKVEVQMKQGRLLDLMTFSFDLLAEMNK
jgi:hypothetical protein